MIRRIALATAAVTAAALTTGITWSPAANADTPTPSAPPVDQTVNLPVGAVTDTLIVRNVGADNDKHDVALVAGSLGTVSIRLDTQAQTVLNKLGTVQQMTIGPDGLVYATEEAAGVGANPPVAQIQSFDPSTGDVVSTWPTGIANCPTDIAFAGSELWFAYACGSAGDTSTANGIAHLDRTDGTVTEDADLATSHEVRLASIPGADHANQLLEADSFVANEGNNLSLLTVSGATATVSNHIPIGGYESHLAVSSDGTTVTVSGQTNGVRTYSTTDLSTVGNTLYDGGVDSLALSTDGQHLATGVSVNGYLYTTAIPSLTALHTYSGDGSYTPAKDSSAWYGNTLLAAYNPYDTQQSSQLRFLNTALQAPAAMSLRSAASVGRAKPLAMTLHLANLDGSPIAGGSVLVAKRDAAGAHTIGTFTMGTDGFFRFTDVPAVGGANRYVAVYAGDENHGPVTVVDNVNVLRGTPVLTMAVTSKLYTYHQTGHLTVHLQSHDVKKVQIWVKAGPAPVHYYTTLTVNAHGDAAMNMTMTYNTVFVVKFYGDYYYNARVISTAVGTRAALVAADAGNYSTSGGYDLYHVGDDVYQGTVVYPNQYGLGTCVHFDIYIWYQGSWQHYASSPCLTLNSNGVGFARLQGAYVTPGYLYRAQSTFDSSQYNVGNVSNFAYFTTR